MSLEPWRDPVSSPAPSSQGEADRLTVIPTDLAGSLQRVCPLTLLPPRLAAGRHQELGHHVTLEGDHGVVHVGRHNVHLLHLAVLAEVDCQLLGGHANG